MKVGDLVISTSPGNVESWIGVIVGWDDYCLDPVVYWSDRFPDEVEYKSQLEVIGNIGTQ